MLHIFDTIEELSRKAAEFFVDRAKAAVAESGRFTVALTGGSSPVALYRLLAQDPFRNEVSWADVFVFWGDERWVPLTDAKSNYKMAKEALLDHVPIPAGQVYPMWAEGVSPEAYAEQYETILRRHFGAAAPRFDLILLGMGDDGHTASLFPGTKILKEEKRLVDAYFLEPQDMYRITLTAPLINQAATIAFLTFGANKARALFEVLKGTPNSDLYPSQLIVKDPNRVHWFVDQAAASRLHQ